MVGKLVDRMQQIVISGVQLLQDRLRSWTTPPGTSLIVGGIHDVARSKPQLVIENAVLRQQLIVLNRSVKRPGLTPTDRRLLVLLASRLPWWKQAVLIIKPETLVRWHRQGFRLVWARTSRACSREPNVPVETITLIKELAANNSVWGAERIRGAVLKVGINVTKRTIQH